MRLLTTLQLSVESFNPDYFNSSETVIEQLYRGIQNDFDNWLLHDFEVAWKNEKWRLAPGLEDREI